MPADTRPSRRMVAAAAARRRRPAARTPRPGPSPAAPPPSRPPAAGAGCAATASATASTSAGSARPAPRRRGAGRRRCSPGPARPSGRSRCRLRPAFPSASASRTLSTECTTSAYRDHRPALVALQLPDEVPADRDAGRGDRGGLRRRLLVAVLPDVGHPQPGQAAHVAGRVGLGDRDQRDLGRLPPGGRAGARDPVPHPGRAIGRRARRGARAVRRVAWTTVNQAPFLRKSGTSTSSKSTRRGGGGGRWRRGRRLGRRDGCAWCGVALRGASAGR